MPSESTTTALLNQISTRVDKTLERLSEAAESNARIEVQQEATNRHLEKLNGSVATLEKFRLTYPLEAAAQIEELRRAQAVVNADNRSRRRNLRMAWSSLLVLAGYIVQPLIKRLFHL